MKMRKLVAMLMAVLMLCSIVPFSAAAESETYVKIATAAEFTSGTYVMVVDTGYAPAAFESGWVTAVQPTVSGNAVTNAKGAVVTLTVDGNSVAIQDAAGNSLAPKGGNANGIKVGEYAWSWSCTNGKFVFAGVGDDTVTLASNSDAKYENKFRAYKNSTVSNEQYAETYPSQFTLYKGDGSAPDVPVDPEPDTPDMPGTPAEVVENPVVGTAYKFGMVQGNVSTTDVYYLVGGMAQTYYLATGTDANAALDVYLEETNGGYYLYAVDEKGTQSYINMVVSADGLHVNGAYAPSPSTVYTYDTDAKTVVATVNDARYWFGTRNDKQYTTVGPCDVEYQGFYCQFYSFDGGTTPDVPPVVPPVVGDVLTIEEAIALGLSMEHNVFTEEKYTVTGVITEVYNEMYGNMRLTDEAGNILTIYGTYSADGETRYDAMAVKPVAGDTVTIYGIVGQYNGTPQIKNGWIVEHIPGEGGGTVEPPPDVAYPMGYDAYIDFTNIANRVSYSTEQQVWEMEGITITNDKDESTSNVGDYGGNGYPARFYKSSTLTIAYPGMTELVIECVGLEAKYVNGWMDSATGADVIYAAESGGFVILQFAEPVDSFTWVPLTSQCRAYRIFVYADVACEHEYAYFEEAPTCTEDGFTYYECPLCGDSGIETILPAVGHVYDDDTDADCNVCGDVREVIANVGSVVISTAQGSAGSTVQVTVSLDGNPGLISAKVKVLYDNTVLKLVNYAAGDFSASGYSWGDIDKANGSFIVNWCDAVNSDSTATLLATLTFEVLEGAANGFTAIEAEFDCEGDMFNAADETVWFGTVNGGVEIADVTFTYGDLNDDGRINNKDLGFLQQYINEWGNTINEAAADVNNDGRINNKDLGLLQQYLNDWNVVFG